MLCVGPQQCLKRFGHRRWAPQTPRCRHMQQREDLLERCCLFEGYYHSRIPRVGIETGNDELRADDGFSCRALTKGSCCFIFCRGRAMFCFGSHPRGAWGEPPSRNVSVPRQSSPAGGCRHYCCCWIYINCLFGTALVSFHPPRRVCRLLTDGIIKFREEEVGVDTKNVRRGDDPGLFAKRHIAGDHPDAALGKRRHVMPPPRHFRGEQSYGWKVFMLGNSRKRLSREATTFFYQPFCGRKREKSSLALTRTDHTTDSWFFWNHHTHDRQTSTVTICHRRRGGLQLC